MHLLREYIQSAHVGSWVGVFLLLFFFSAFCAVLYYSWKMPKSQVERWSRLPLDGE